jgi:hypothetical protein
LTVETGSTTTASATISQKIKALASGWPLVGHSGEAFDRVCAFVSEPIAARHLLFSLANTATLDPRCRPTTLKVSLQTRNPKEALRWSRILSYVGHVLISYGAARGMTFQEIRKLLTAHFGELLTERKARIAKDGRLTQTIDTRALVSS